jgi:hypothetical protein
MTVAIPCVPPPTIFADCFSLAVFPSHVSDPQDGGHGLWFASGCSRCELMPGSCGTIAISDTCSSSSVVQFFAVAAPLASSSSVKRAVDQPPEPTLELRCDAHRCRCYCYSAVCGIICTLFFFLIIEPWQGGHYCQRMAHRRYVLRQR